MTPGDEARLEAFRALCRGQAVMICTGCSSVESMAKIHEHSPAARSCCPERKMVMHRLFTVEMLRKAIAMANARASFENQPS